MISLPHELFMSEHYPVTLRLLLLAGTNFSVLVVCCIWQVFILAFFDEFLIDYK